MTNFLVNPPDDKEADNIRHELFMILAFGSENELSAWLEREGIAP